MSGEPSNEPDVVPFTDHKKLELLLDLEGVSLLAQFRRAVSISDLISLTLTCYIFSIDFDKLLVSLVPNHRFTIDKAFRTSTLLPRKQ